MKKTLLIIALIAGGLFTKVIAQTDAEKAWMAYMTPGDVHKMMAKSEGKWNDDVTFWMKPGDAPTKSKSVSECKMILGGRYQQSTTKGEMMGSPFEGMNLLGYDNAKKVFISTWIDNMGTGVMTLEGKWDNMTKTINFKGNCVDPMTGKEMGVRETYQIVDDDTHKMEMFMIQDGKEFKSMLLTSTRAK